MSRKKEVQKMQGDTTLNEESDSLSDSDSEKAPNRDMERGEGAGLLPRRAKTQDPIRHGQIVNDIDILKAEVSTQLDEILDKAVSIHHQRESGQPINDCIQEPKEIVEEYIPNRPMIASDSEETVDSESDSSYSTSDTESESGSAATAQSPTKDKECAEVSDDYEGVDDDHDPNVVYKFDAQYSEFIQDITRFLSHKMKIIFEPTILFDEFLFPNDIMLRDYIRVNSTCPGLRKLVINLPNLHDFVQEHDLKTYFQQIVGDHKGIIQKELLLRDRVTFILRSIKADKLNEFIFKNLDSGLDVCAQDRMTVLEDHLVNFLNIHSPHLKTVLVKSSRLFGQSGKDYSEHFQYQRFPELESLMIILWELPRKTLKADKKSKEHSSKAIPQDMSSPSTISNYWTELLRSRAHYGQLRKLIWVSYEGSSWQEMFTPVIQSNKDTLEMLHIICLGDWKSLLENLQKYSADAENFPRHWIRHAVISCAEFSHMPKLKSLYLRKAHGVLEDLTLLPPQLEELLLDGMIVTSEDLEKGLGRLSALKKLRLVDNTPRPMERGGFRCEKCSETRKEYGVREQLLRVIFGLRNLEQVSIWGHRVKVPKQSPEKKKFTSKKGAVADDQSAPIVRKKSRFQKFASFLRSIGGKSKKKKAPAPVEKPAEEVLSLTILLSKIASFTAESIVIDQSLHEDGTATDNKPKLPVLTR